MKHFIQKIAFWFFIFLLYKLTLFSITLFCAKESLHTDLGVKGKNQKILVGSSNVYFSYNYEKLNSISDNPIRSCWTPASYGLALNLYKLNLIAKKGNHLIVEYPYHWYLFDLMAPHNSSFYSRATKEFYAFFVSTFPIDFLGHLFTFSVYHGNYWEYLIQKNEPKKEKNNSNLDSLTTSISVDTSYYTCNSNLYKKPNHNVQANTFQKFQFDKIISYFQKLKKEKELLIYFNYPSMEVNNFSVNPEIITSIKTSFPTLITFKESLWSRKFMFDQRYHLNNCGAISNSTRFLTRISKNKNT